MRTKLSDNAKYYVVLLLIGVFYLCLAWNTTPTLTDDLLYQFKFTFSDPDYRNPQPIKSLKDVFESMSVHYVILNGRLVVHTLAQIILTTVPKHIFDVVNTFMFVLLLHIIINFLDIKTEKITYTLMLVSLMFVGIIGFQSCMLWNLGTLNYLWVLVVTFLFLNCLKKYGKRKLRWYHWLLSIPVILIGWSHEGISLPISIAFVFIAIQKRKTLYHTLTFPLMFFYSVGTLICILSPGMFNGATSNTSLSLRLINALVLIVMYSRILWLLIFTLVVLWFKNRNIIIDNIKENYFLWIIGFISYGIAYGSGSVGVRHNFYAEFFALLILIKIWGSLTFSFRRVATIIVSTISVIFFVCALYCCRLQVNDYNFVMQQLNTPNVTVIRTPNTQPKGKFLRWIYETYVVPFASYNYFQVYMGFNPDSENIRCAAVKYHKPYLIFLPSRLVDMIDDGTLSSSHFTLFIDDNTYAIKLNTQKKVSQVIFNLSKEDVSKLHFWQRAVAYSNDTYILDDNRWKEVSINGRRYLFLIKPLTNVYRRINNIEIKLL